MLTWILIALLTAGLWTWGRKKTRQGRAAALPVARPLGVLERGLKDLRQGDVVEYGGQDYSVQGTLRYDEDGHSFCLGRLCDGNEECWLMTGWEHKRGSVVRILWPTGDLDLGDVPPEIVSHERVAYRLTRHGSALVSTHGDLGELAETLASEHSPRCFYWRYQAAPDKCLLVEKWGRAFRILAGHVVNEEDLSLLVGS